MQNTAGKCVGGLMLTAVLCLAPMAAGQDRYGDRDRDRYPDQDRISRLEPGTLIPVRLNDSIDVERRDNRIYTGIVDQDVRGDNGRVAIRRGATAEMIVRVAPDNDLILDLESVMVNGQRYAVRTDRTRVDSQRDNTLVGNIIGAVTGADVRGRAVRIPRDSVISFRLTRPLDVGVPDRGIMRDGYHYHDYYDRPDRDR